MKNVSRFGLLDLMEFHKRHRMSLPPSLILVTDLDDTLIGIDKNETHEYAKENLKKFNELWLKKYACNCVLVYATGRSYEKYLDAAKEWPLLKPDILICQNGGKIYWFNKQLINLVQMKSNSLVLNDESTEEDFILFDASWDNYLGEGWNQQLAQDIKNDFINKYPSQISSEKIEKCRVGVIAETKELALEASEYFKERIVQYNMENLLKNPNFISMNVNYLSYISPRDTWWSFMMPLRCGKGEAVSWIQSLLYSKSNYGKNNKIIVCGDNGNDISMLNKIEYCSVMMKNSSFELIQYYNDNKNIHKNMIMTKNERTLGVIEGLQYFSKCKIN